MQSKIIASHEVSLISLFIYAQLIVLSVCNASQMMFCAVIFRFISWSALGNLSISSGGTIFGLFGGFFSLEDGFDRKQDNRFLLFRFSEV